MKRESGRNLTHHFSFGEWFDETLMKGYSACYQYISLSNHQFIEIRAYAAHPRHGRTDSDGRAQESKEEASGWQAHLPQESQCRAPVCR